MPKKGKKGKGKKTKPDPVLERQERKKADIKRELKMQDIMGKTLTRKWHQMVITMKIPAMKEDFKARRIIFDRVMSKKQCVINEILRQKEYADDQTRMNLASAVEIIDQTIKRFGDLLDEMNTTYKHDRNKVLKGAAKLKAQDKKMWDNEETRMGILKWADVRHFTEVFDEIYGEGVVRHYEMENMLKTDLEDTEDSYENLFSDILTEYRNEIKNYNEKTLENKEKSLKMQGKDDMMCKILQSQDKMLADSQKIIEDLQQEAASYEDGTATAEIRERFNKYKEEYNAAKFTLARDMHLDENQFMYLVDKSNDAIWWLESKLKNCKKIITAMNMCECLQTQSERFSCYRSMYRCTCGDNKLLDCEDIEITDNLKYLFSTIVEADVATKALIEERNKLKVENQMLCKQIKKIIKSMKEKL